MQVFGHRGGKAYGPENTIGTMKKSFALGAHGVEMDIRCTMEDIPVVLHDATVDRTTNGVGEIYQMKEHAVAQLDAGEGLHVPTLAKVLEVFRNGEQVFILDLKHPATALPTAELVHTAITQRKMAHERFIIVSMYHQLITLIKDKYPKILTGASLQKMPESLAACGEYTRARYILPPIDSITDAFLEDAQARNLYVIAWDVESASQLKKAKKMGLYGIITSDPDAALS